MPLDLHDLEADKRFRNFNWEKARSFYIVAKMGSFSKAATFLHVNQSGLSRQVMELEKTLDTRLFIRMARGVKLTRKGEELYAIIESTFLDLKGFTRNIYAETNQGKKRKISVATTQPLAAYLINDLILEYNEIKPDLVFEVITDDHLIDLTLNDVDIAIRTFDSKAKGICQEHILTLEKKLYASQGYIYKYGEPKTIEDLKHHKILARAHPKNYPYSDLEWILRIGMPNDELHEPAYTSTSTECLIEAAKKDRGIIGSYEQMKILREANLKNILPDIRDKKNKFYFIYPDYLKDDSEIKKLKSFLYEKLDR